MNNTASQLLTFARSRHCALMTAESCTGGLVAGALTAVPGSSDVVLGGWVTYANSAKIQMLDVPEALIATHGAVSEHVARAMAEGALRHAIQLGDMHTHHLTVAVTGIAGPGGGSMEKPVGTVHLAAAHSEGRVLHRLCRFEGDRTAIREARVQAALELMVEVLVGC